MSPRRTTFLFADKSKLTFDDLNNGKVGLPMAVLKKNYMVTAKKLDWSLGNILEENNFNLSIEYKEFFTLHYKLVHFNTSWVQKLTRPRSELEEPILKTRYPKTKSVPISGLKCDGCEKGKAHRQPKNVANKNITPEKDGGVKHGHLRLES